MNDKQIKAAVSHAKATGKRADLRDEGQGAERGLVLRLTPAGGARWVLRATDREGRQRRFDLGRWPGVGIAEARAEARQVRAGVDRGADPIATSRTKRKATKDARTGIGTLSALIDAYAATDHAQRQKRWPENKRRMEDVFAKHLNSAMSTLSRADLQRTANAHGAAQSAAAAIRYIRPVLKWAENEGRIPEEFDAARLKPPATVSRRDRVLTEAELRALLPVLRASDSPYAAALRLMMDTLGRREEVCGLTWGRVDFEYRYRTTQEDTDVSMPIVTFADTKNKTDHITPLSRQAVVLLQSRRPKHAAPDSLVFQNTSGGRLQNWDRETKKLMEASGTAGWTRHDLRRTGATRLGELGFLPDIIEAALNHTSIKSQLAANYNKSRYRPQVATALQSLADWLDNLKAASPKPSVNQ